MTYGREAKPGKQASPSGGAGARADHEHDGGDLQRAHLALQLVAGGRYMPGIIAQAEQAIAQRSYSGAVAAARGWQLNKPLVELLARSMDPFDPDVARAQAALDRMRAVEPKLPRHIFTLGLTELDHQDRLEWLAQIGAAPTPDSATSPASSTKPDAPPSVYAGAKGEVAEHADVGAEELDGTGRSEGGGPGLGDIARGLVVPVWAQNRTFRRRVLGAGNNPVMDGVDDVLEGLINDPDFAVGFAVGAGQGCFGAIRDCLRGPYDLAKLAAEVTQKLAMYKHLELLQSLRNTIKSVPAAVELLGKRWNDDSDRRAQGEFQGEVVGYIGTQLAIMVITAAAAPLAEVAGPFAAVIRVIAAVGDPLNAVREVAMGVRLSNEAVAALRAARGAQRAEAIAADAASAARTAEHGLAAVEPAATRGLDVATDGAGAGARAVDGAAAHAPADGPPLLYEAAKPLSRTESLAEALPADLRGRVRVVESPVLTDSTVRVAYRDGVELIVGAEATPRHVAYHAETVRALLRYEGLGGKIRKLLDQVLSLLRLRAGYGTRGFEADLEVQKLTAMRDDLQRLLAKSDGMLHGDDLDPAILRAEFQSVEAQLAEHQSALGSYADGAGHVEARGLAETRVQRSDLFINVLEDQRAVVLEFRVSTPDGAARRWGTATIPLDEHGLPLSGPILELDATLYLDADATRMVIKDGDASVPATEYALERTENFYKKRFGSSPQSLDGDLAAQNKLNFQREWFALISKGVSVDEAPRLAVAKISFGKHRAQRGYDQFDVHIAGQMEEVDLGPPFGKQQVPTGIKVTARKAGGE